MAMVNFRKLNCIRTSSWDSDLTRRFLTRSVCLPFFIFLVLVNIQGFKQACGQTSNKALRKHNASNASTFVAPSNPFRQPADNPFKQISRDSPITGIQTPTAQLAPNPFRQMTPSLTGTEHDELIYVPQEAATDSSPKIEIVHTEETRKTIPLHDGYTNQTNAPLKVSLKQPHSIEVFEASSLPIKKATFRLSEIDAQLSHTTQQPTREIKAPVSYAHMQDHLPQVGTAVVLDECKAVVSDEYGSIPDSSNRTVNQPVRLSNSPSTSSSSQVFREAGTFRLALQTVPPEQIQAPIPIGPDPEPYESYESLPPQYSNGGEEILLGMPQIDDTIINELNVDMRPLKRVTKDKIETKEQYAFDAKMPANKAAEEQGTYKEAPQVGVGSKRYQSGNIALWAAPKSHHQPLYFEEPNLERYGHHVHGQCVQSALSAAHFFGSIPLLPYKIGAKHPLSCEYSLGRYRPGNCNPRRREIPELSKRGLFNQGLFITGAAFLVP